jgi:glycosyltransferase involved in cell wall biosynthesis
MKVLWISDSPDSSTGYGNVTHFVCSGLARCNHKVQIVGFQTRESRQYGDCQLYAGNDGDYGRQAVYALLCEHRPDVVVALTNIWWLTYFMSAETRQRMELTDTPFMLYFPVDGDTGANPPLPNDWIEKLRAVDFPVAMSLYGQGVTQRCGISCDYIPHGVDLSLFCPPVSGRAAAKARLGYEGKFVVLSDCRNQPRKMLPRLLEIFAKFRKGRPGALLHLHTDPLDEAARLPWYSYDLQADLQHFDLESQVRFSTTFSSRQEGGLPLSQLAAIYQAADVHLLASSGEGFGLPTLQAAAVGAVPMACAYSASLELTRGHGEPLNVSEWGETGLGIRRAFVDIDYTVDKLVQYYEHETLLKSKSVEARSFAAAYGWETVLDQWIRFLERAVNISSRNQWRIPRRERKRNTETTGAIPRSVCFNKEMERSELRIPVVPRDYYNGNLQIPRRPGALIVTSCDISVFVELRKIFPILNGVVIENQSSGSVLPLGLEFSIKERRAMLSYRMAQSCLLLHVGSDVMESTLFEAALFGVLAVGRPGRVQSALWPTLTIRDSMSSVELVRSLLTNVAMYERLAKQARTLCLSVFMPDELVAEQHLRQMTKFLETIHPAQMNVTSVFEELTNSGEGPAGISCNASR